MLTAGQMAQAVRELEAQRQALEVKHG